MKKLAVLFLIAAALLCFQREAPAAPLTDGQAEDPVQPHIIYQYAGFLVTRFP